MTDFTGGIDDDLFNGTPEPDVAHGGDGNDELYGGGGDDHLMGEGGNDILHGGAGKDWIDGGDGDDLLVIAYGEVPVDGDRFTGGDGFDTLTVQSPPYPSSERIDLTKAQFDADLEKLTGPQGISIRPDQLASFSVLDGNFALVGAGSVDFTGKTTSGWLTLSQEGNAVTLSSSGFSQVTALGGNDVIDGSVMTLDQDLSGGGGDDILRGGSGDDKLYGQSGFDRLEGGAGNDYLSGGGGDPDYSNYDPYAGASVPDPIPVPADPPRTGFDTLIGGTGDDFYEVFQGADVVVELAGEGNDTVLAYTSYALPTGAEIETLQVYYSGSTAPINLTGNEFDNRILGAAGDNVLDGRAGNDLLFSGAGADSLIGGGGDDGLFFGASFGTGDIADGGAGNDTLALQGNYANLTLAGVTNIEVLLAVSGKDASFGDSAGNLYAYHLTSVDSNVAAGGQLSVIATDLRAGESLAFDGSAETDGNFRIFAGQGVDDLKGGAGSDGFFFGADGNLTAADRVDGGAGLDSVALRGNYVGAGALHLVDASFTGIETLVFLSGHGNEYGGPLSPAGFDYDLTLADGNVAAGQRLDVIATTLGADESLSFDGGAETDGSFRILSGAGDDTLLGGSGSDTIWGALGADTIDGGAGADTYIYRSTAESTATSQDNIAFGVGDRIDLSVIDAIPGGDNDAFAFIGGNAFSHTAGELHAVDGGGGHWLVEADVNGDGLADFSLAVTAALPLAANDFVL